MMLYRVFLTVLTLLPFRAVAYTAETRLSEFEPLEVKHDSPVDTWAKFYKQKMQLFEPRSVVTTQEQAYNRFLKLNKLDNSAKSFEQFDTLVKTMMKEGLIQENEKFLRSSGPSES